MEKHYFLMVDSNIELNEQERQILENIVSAMASHLAEDIDRVIDYLVHCSYATVLKLYCKNTEIKNFCQSNTRFHNVLSKILKDYGYINIEINAMDGKERFTIFDHYMAALSMHNYYTNLVSAHYSKEIQAGAIRALDIACELGLYNALVARCKQNIKKIISVKPSDANNELSMQIILEDDRRLSNLYWGIGYIQAGCLLQEIANFFLKVKMKEKGVLLHEKAIKYFLCAFLLKDNAYSNEIINTFTSEERLLSLFNQNDVEISSWDEVQILLNSWVEDSDYERIFLLAEKEIEGALMKGVK